MVAEKVDGLDPTIKPATEVVTAEKRLNKREVEVLRCFLEGMSVGEIADKLNRSPKTISTQKRLAFKKLGISSDSDLYKLENLFNN